MAGTPGAVHTEPKHWPWVDDPERWEHSEHAFVFTIVRNPYVRVLSAYSDKIREPGVWDPFTARHGLSDAQLSFIEFLKLIAGEAPDQMDPHWRPQSHIVAPRIVPYDFIGTVENFEQDFRHILKQIFHQEMPISVHRPHRTDAIERMAEYTPEAITLVRRIYESDFVELGYSTDPAQLERQGPAAKAARAPLRHWGAALRLLRERDVQQATRELQQALRWLQSPLVEERLLTCYLELAQSRKAAQPELAAMDLAKAKDLAMSDPLLVERIERQQLACSLRLVEWHENAQPGQAVQHMAQVIALSSCDHRLWKRYGRILAAAGQHEEALEALIQALIVLGAGRRRRLRRLKRLRRSLALLRARHGRRKDALAALQLGQALEADRHSRALSMILATREKVDRTVVLLVASAAMLIRVRGENSRADMQSLDQGSQRRDNRSVIL